MAPEAQLVAGRYRLRHLLAAGGMGRVWLATDEMLHRPVAIKRCALPDGLSADEQELVRGLMLREARAFARVSHPNVVRILEVLPDEDEPWIVMEYVASRSLQQVVAEAGALPPERVAAVGLAVLNGLNAAFRAGVLHLDVKPSNVLIGDDDRVVLSDFGPAVTDEGVRALAGMGIVLGSPKYIAPERLADGVSTPQADLWSLGATLYHAVEGRPPYVQDSTEATLRALADSMPDPPRQAGPLTDVLEGLLRRDPAARLLPSDVADRLRRAADPLGPASTTGRLVRPRARRRVMALAAAATVLAVLAAVAVGTQRGEEASARSMVRPSPSAPAPFALPRGFGWWTDPAGFRVAVPSGWRPGRDGTGALVFSARPGQPSLRISSWTAPKRNVVATFIAEERDVGLADYRRIRIETPPEQPDAVWEYTFRDSRVGVVRGLRRVVSSGKHSYLIEWRAPRTAWAVELPTLTVVLNSFGPPIGA